MQFYNINNRNEYDQYLSSAKVDEIYFRLKNGRYSPYEVISNNANHIPPHHITSSDLLKEFGNGCQYIHVYRTNGNIEWEYKKTPIESIFNTAGFTLYND